MKEKKRKIVIACEEGPLRDDLSLELEKRGIEVYTAGNGSSALEITLFRLPDLLILCFALGVIPSEKLIQILRANPRTRNTPIIGLSPEEKTIPLFKEGIDTLMIRPINVRELTSLATRMLKHAQSGSEYLELQPHVIQVEASLSETPEVDVKGELEEIEEIDVTFEDFRDSAENDSRVSIKAQDGLPVNGKIEIPDLEESEIEQLGLEDPFMEETGEEETPRILPTMEEHDLSLRAREREIGEDQPEPAILIDGGEKVLLKAFWDLSGSIDTAPKGAEALRIEEEASIGQPGAYAELTESEKADTDILAVSPVSPGSQISSPEPARKEKTKEDTPGISGLNVSEPIIEEAYEDPSRKDIVKDPMKSTETLSKTTIVPSKKSEAPVELDEPFPVTRPKIYPLKIIDLEWEKEMIGLYQTIESLLPSGESKTIQFIGSREGEGTSTIIREFAKAVAIKAGKSVLLMDADFREPSQHLYFDIEAEYSLEEIITNGKPLHNALCQVANTRLYLNLISKNSDTALKIYNSSEIIQFFHTLKERCDLILIDSPPANTSPESLVFTSLADGVVLVMEAENTRWMVAESVKKRIVKNGGNLLGTVLNKKRYHIPAFIYKRL